MGKRLAGRATSAASKASKKTKQVARNAQKVGRVVGVIGSIVEAGGRAAEELTVEVERRTRKASAPSRKSSVTASGKTRKTRKKR